MGLGSEIKKSDLNYAVEDIKINGKSFWPFFKVFFFDAQFVKGGTQTSFGLSQKLKFVFSLFYGWTNWFGKVDYFVFSNSDQRKLVEGKYIDKSADYINLSLKNTLHFELPVFAHFPISKLKFQRVVSHLPLRILESVYIKFRLGSAKLDGQKVVDALNNDFNTDLNPSTLGKRFYAQYWMMKMLLAWKKPKAIFLVVSYMKMGYVLAAKEQNVKVVEMQHGSVNKSHFGYANYKLINSNLFPDYLLAYGNETSNVFTDGNLTFNEKNVFPIGHYYLKLIQESNVGSGSEFNEVKRAKVSIAVSLQDDSIGRQIVPFLNKVALTKPEWVFVFIPRKTAQKSYEQMKLAKNIVFLPSLNVYEIIKLCKIHTSVFSTCALEAPTIGRPNVLVNLENKSVEYFSKTLTNKRVTRMVNTVDEFIEEVDKNNFPNEMEIKKSNQAIMKPGFAENLRDAFNQMKIETA